MPLRCRLLPPLVLLLAAAPPAVAQTTPLDAEAVTVLEREVLPGQIDGIVEPGDTVELIPRVFATGGVERTSISGRLTSERGDVSLISATSPFPDLPADGSEVANTATPFKVRLPDTAALRCGGKADFSIALRDGTGRLAPFSHTIVTGAPGVAQTTSTSVPLAIPANGTLVESTITVPETDATRGRTTSAVEVVVDGLTHARVRDLELTLVAPSGTEALLMPSVAGTPGADLRSTRFATSGLSLGDGTAPYTGTFEAPGLAELGGQTLAGEWKLRVDGIVDGGQSGTLTGWSVRLAPATCDPVVTARITRDPPVGPIGGNVLLSAATSLPGPGETIATVGWDVGADGSIESTAETHTLASLPRTTSHLRLVRVTVTDSGGNVDSEELLIPFSNAPTAQLGAVPTLPTGSALVFDASGSTDPDGDSIVEFRWDVDGDGQSFERTSGAAPTLDVTYERPPGTRAVRVEATDGFGAKGIATRNVTATNRRPTAGLTTAKAWVPVDEPFTLDAGGSSDPDGEVARLDWDLDGDGACDDRQTTATTTTTTLTTLGLTVLGVCATDDLGASSLTPATVAVGATRRPTAIIGGAATVKPREPLALTGLGSADPDGDAITRWEWDLDGDGAYDAEGATKDPSWPQEGTRTVGLRVTDARGVTGTTTKQITVHNPPPVAALTLTPAVAPRGAPVVLDARGSSDDAAVVAYTFDLDGDGSFETPSATGTATRTYPNAQVLSVGVRVADAGGKVATRRATLTVVAPPSALGTPLPGGTATTPQPGTAATPGTGTGTAATTRLAAALTGLAAQRRTTVLRHGIALRCTAERAVTCSLRATVARATAQRLGLARNPRTDVTVGTATARNGALRLRLTRAAAAKLRRVRSIVVTVRGTARDASGATAPISRAVRVRR